MGLFNNWPYTNLHELNLDWIIQEVKKAVKEVEDLNLSFNELKKYVEDYFKNLDITEEVNNKIDEMAASGELEEIILHALELGAVLSFNTINDLIEADNLINGSNTRIMGKTAYNDGFGAFYHIRDLQPSDVIDGDLLVELEHYPNLVAEKLPDHLDSDLKRESVISSIMPECSGFAFGITKDSRNNSPHANGGICYHNNTMYIAYTSNDDISATIERVTMDGTVIGSYTANMGHVNSITFNPVLNKLVVANVTSNLFLIDENLQSSEVFDLTTLSLSEIGEVAYDPVREVMILGSYNLYVVNAELTKVIAQMVTPELWDGYPQGITVYDGLVVRNFNNIEKIRYEYIEKDYSGIKLLREAYLQNIRNGVLLGELEDVELANINGNIVLFTSYTTLWNATSYTSIWKAGISAGNGQDRPIIDRNRMYVDINYTGLSTGTQDKPYKSLTEAISHCFEFGSVNQIFLLSDIEAAKHNNFFDVKGISFTIAPQVNITHTIAIANAGYFGFVNSGLTHTGNLNLQDIDRLYVQVAANEGIIQAVRVQGEIEAMVNRLIANQSILVCQRNITTLEGSQGSIVTANAITTRTGFTRGLSVAGVQNL